jgi:CHAD domain-containing protein
MEIEAKFALPDAATFQRLQAVDHVAGFALSAHQVQQVHDTYLDTGERRILAGGYACRRRQTESEILITLKELGSAEGAIHRRRELEISLPSDQPPSEWPESPVRDILLGLTQGASLTPLFNLRQTRVFRRMSQGELLVAQLSLDNVRLVANRRKKSYFELEVELAPQGTGSDMAAIVAFLHDEWNLEPEPRSKFQRALALLDAEVPGEAFMTPQERAFCAQIAKRRDANGRKARGLLLLDEGVSQEEVAHRTDRTERTVRRWLADFQEARIGAFPERILREVHPSPAAILPLAGPERSADAEPDEAQQTQPEPQPLSVLFKRYMVDRAHARKVADHAVGLFDHLNAFHGLPHERRSLLETAAQLHNVGLTVDAARHHEAGRDILLLHPPEELGEEERLMVAFAAYVHRRHTTPEELDEMPSQDFAGLSTQAREDALTISALIRMANGLDYSKTRSSELARVATREGVTTFEVAGPYAAVDAARAQEGSDLWHLLFEAKLKFKPARPGDELVPRYGEEADLATADLVPDEYPEHAGVSADDTMVQAARKVLTLHFQRVLYHEAGTRAGEDIEELHGMRVAIRRMNAALRIFGDYADSIRLETVRNGVRRAGRKLGGVRDLDVFWEKAQAHIDALPPDRQGDLMPLWDAFEVERERARDRLLAYLDSDRYAQFKRHTAELLQRADAWKVPKLTSKGDPMPYRVRHVAPLAVYEQAMALLANDEWVSGARPPLKRLHRLRIAARRLRYTLEFFREVLAPQTGDLLARIAGLENHLGDLQDAVVASGLLREFLTWGTWGRPKRRKGRRPKEPILAPGVVAYMAETQMLLRRRLTTFPEIWDPFRSPEFKQALAVAVAPL